LKVFAPLVMLRANPFRTAAAIHKLASRQQLIMQSLLLEMGDQPASRLVRKYGNQAVIFNRSIAIPELEYVTTAY